MRTRGDKKRMNRQSDTLLEHSPSGVLREL
jgi:hypothetical protein